MIVDINSPQHLRHSKGFEEAMVGRKATYHADPKPFMKRTRDAFTGKPLKATPVQKLAKMPFVTVDQMTKFRKSALKIVTDLSCDL